jgi:hypothetical protein
MRLGLPLVLKAAVIPVALISHNITYWYNLVCTLVGTSSVGVS